MIRAIDNAALLGAGLFVWTLLEYALHGWLGHTLRTFAAPLHQVHHRDPRRVFAVGAWLPVAAILIAGVARWGFAPAMVVLSGTAAGFAAYETLHYRIHFATPRGRVEACLRERHLVHHYRAPHRCFGVTSALWDRVLGSDLPDAEMRRLRASIIDVLPLTGASNLGALLHRRLPSAD
jgi:dihydroceramide fatty acyl 2-hydroxylase